MIEISKIGGDWVKRSGKCDGDHTSKAHPGDLNIARKYPMKLAKILG